MKLGGPIFEPVTSPAQWVAAHQRLGYTAAFAPVDCSADDATVAAYCQAAAEAGITLAEVGAWSNPLSPDPATRAAAREHCKRQLDLAERLGASCCVNIAGSLGEKWDGPCPADLTGEAFTLVVESVQEIIDAVGPARTFYTLETMPWMVPDSVDSYLALLQAVDRPALAVHFDPVNLINSPQRYFRNADLIRDFCTRLGPSVKSCHAKDTLLGQTLTVHLDEVRPGLGALDYAALLPALEALDPAMPLMLEHLPTDEDYRLAAGHVRTVAAQVGVTLR
jgi:sugar phosphate isomerase/epimerase